MNGFVDQDVYEDKKSYFADESMFVSTRELGSEYAVWNEASITERSEKLGNWAVTRWPKET